ncbi:hypothetical protein ACFFRR_000320 [Megaselia abdita]
MQCEIKFHNNPKGYYNAGETIVGCAIITLPEKLSIQGIAFKVNGYGESKWPPKKQKKPKIDKKTGEIIDNSFHGREDYLSTVNFLLGSEKALSIEMPPGKSFYDFQCTIPKNCPSSFEGQHGHIRYEACLEIISPGNAIIHTEGFTVSNITENNIKAPHLMVPINMESSRSFCCKSGDVNLYMDLPKTGFVSGEEIPITVKVENNAGVYFKSLIFHFNQVIQYTSYQPKIQIKTSAFSLADKNLILSGAASRTMQGSLVIPEVPPTSEAFSKVIRISYEISVIIETTRKKIIRSSVPVIIGYEPVEITAPAPRDTVDVQSIGSISSSMSEYFM